MHNHQKLEITEMSLNFRMDTQTVVHAFNEPQLSNKREQLMHGTIWMNLKGIMQVKMATHESTMYGPIYMAF